LQADTQTTVTVTLCLAGLHDCVRQKKLKTKMTLAK